MIIDYILCGVLLLKGRDVVLGLLMQKELSVTILKLCLKTYLLIFDGSFGMIYPTLRQLENEGK